MIPGNVSSGTSENDKEPSTGLTFIWFPYHTSTDLPAHSIPSRIVEVRLVVICRDAVFGGRGCARCKDPFYVLRAVPRYRNMRH